MLASVAPRDSVARVGVEGRGGSGAFGLSWSRGLLAGHTHPLCSGGAGEVSSRGGRAGEDPVNLGEGRGFGETERSRCLQGAATVFPGERQN